MRLRELLLSTAMMSIVFAATKAMTPPIPSSVLTEDKILSSAYHDTLTILLTPSECSDFFGGSTAASIFNNLMGKVRKEYFSSAVGIRMSGETINVMDAATNRKYRLFDKVSINANGPFYRKSNSNQGSIAGIGSFKANSKEGRVLMFLHELGHVIKTESGEWLLPDDGRDDVLSQNNTRKIEEVCGEQIKSLSKGDNPVNPAGGKQLNEKRTVAEAKP
jgi:hypothetical protein